MKAALHNLGCKVNAYETEVMQELLEKSGYEIVDFHEQADVYVINTCSVTNIADRKSRQMLHQAKNRNPESIVVAAGCYVQTSQEAARLDSSIDIILGNDQKNELPHLLEEYRKSHNAGAEAILDLTNPKEYEKMQMEHTGEHTRAFVKVQDGCNQFCTYCIIPYARGRIRSKNLEEIIMEITNLAKNGIKEVVLTGIHLSSYGLDKEDGIYLIDLIEQVAKIEGIKRIRLGSLEPRIITEEFLDRLKKVEKICPHFHLSLQSGCDTVLQRMNRKYSADEYFAACEMIRKTFTHPALTTDVIVGFPGETEEEFQITKEFLEKIHFYEVHLFKYSRRKGTPADKMPNQIVEAKKAERSHILADDQAPRMESFRSYYLNRPVEILLEEIIEIDGEEFFVGFNKEYVKMGTKVSNLSKEEKEKWKVNDLVTITPTQMMGDLMI